MLRRGLSDEGFEPVLAADGATAPRLATGGIAAAVLDVGLPDADGRDVCQAMRANGFAAPVIFWPPGTGSPTVCPASPRAVTSTCPSRSTSSSSPLC
ncbi:hypothetical protein SHL15_7479 [Streptomyces hygroscopicus subsp. limoneus]|nr:hypothetical protein SHL15_7479 [Streptomyces hygroscopicus subsp. limoneus]